MDYLQNNWSTLCLACVGGALGYYYQYSRPVSAAELGTVYAKVVTEKVHDYLTLPDKIIGNVMEKIPKIPKRLKHEVEIIFQEKTHLDWIWESFERLREYIWDDLNFSELLKTIKRNKLFIVFSCTGFLLVYYSVNKFVNRNRTTGRGKFRKRVNNNRFSNPFELLFGYCLHQTRRISEIFKKDPVPSSLFIATVLLVIFKLYVKVEYHPEQDVFEFKYSKN